MQDILNTLSDNDLYLEWQNCSTTSAICHDIVKRQLYNWLAIKKQRVASDLVSMGIEDSHHRFYDGINQIIMRGHIAKTFQFCKDIGVNLIIGPNLKLITTHHPKYDPSFIENLVIAKDGNQVSLREHQMKFFEWGIKNRSGVGISATGSGKTMILYCMIRYLQNENPDTKIKIIVPNVTLITQALDDFADYSSLDDSWNVDENCTKMHGSKKPDYTKNILITTWQSLKGHRRDFYEQWNHVFVDEVHGADAPVLKNVILKCTNAYTKIGMTGSLKGSGASVNSISEMELIGLFGGRMETFSTAPQLMDLGLLPRMKLVRQKLVYPKHVYKALQSSSEVLKEKKLQMQDHLKLYQEERSFIHTVDERLDWLLNLAEGIKGSGVLFFNNIEYLQSAYDRYILTGTKKAHIIYGAVKNDVRKDILYTQFAQDDEEHLLFSTYNTTATGISVDNFRFGIMAESIKARVKVLQSMGRMLRGTEAIVIDLEDDLNNGRAFLSRHANERKELYDSLGYVYSERVANLEISDKTVNKDKTNQLF